MHRVAMNLKSIASLNNMCKSGDAACERLFDIMDTVPEIADSEDAIDLGGRQVAGHIVFENVRFAYQPDEEVLHGISFEVKPGEVIALAGLSGSGKTTISNLVPRLYDPTGGRVLVDGFDLREVKLQSLRAHIGAVPQETTLFHGTIRDNIAYGKPEATLEEITAAARRANAHDFISEQPEGYDTQVGERGGRLSGGQRQRIAIARALLRDPRILILDEATSSLDAESESLVQEALGRLMEGRTTLIIAHRFSTIRHANRILVLASGRVAETGTHDELLARDGIYRRLYQMQTFAAHAEAGEAAGQADAHDASRQPDAPDLTGAALAI
jgi:subfamily B ATP-binding cassette protein MsbA